MKNIIQFLISEHGFEHIAGPINFSFSYSMEGHGYCECKKGNISVWVGLTGSLHLSLVIKKDGQMAYFQEAMQINNEQLLKVIDIISKENYSYKEKILEKRTKNKIGFSVSSMKKSYEFDMLKDAGIEIFQSWY